jgi:hypothetical protein
MGFADLGWSCRSGHILSSNTGRRMKNRRSLVSTGISFVALALLLAGCPIQEADTYPNGDPRPSGGGPIPATGPGGGGGMGGAGGGNGGAGGCNCEPMPCLIGQCIDSGCKYLPDPQADGTACSGDMSKVCSNGECLLAQGQPCASNGDCASEACANGVCCDSLCDGTCQACDLPDQPGTCGDVLDGTTHPKCPPGQACMGNVCKSGGANGDTCQTNSGCLSKNCVAMSCRLPDGEPCNDPVQCASNYCGSIKKCDAPPDSKLCKSGQQSGLTCLAAPGEPCGSNLDCASDLSCAGNICRADNGTDCTSYYQCYSGFCNIPAGETMGICSSCTGAPNECGGGMCFAGKCPSLPFPEGAYCINDSYCAAGLVCTGFPRRCTKP